LTEGIAPTRGQVERHLALLTGGAAVCSWGGQDGRTLHAKVPATMAARVRASLAVAHRNMPVEIVEVDGG
jgi:hypothetical protein